MMLEGHYYDKGQLDDSIHPAWGKVKLVDITGDTPTLTFLFKTEIN